jgi:tryptophan 7-halogenase
VVQGVSSIVIVGGGTAGWMAAAALARFLPAGSSIRVVESDEIGTVGVGEATIPQIRLFNEGLGIDEDAFVAATGGTFKLGIEFVGWGAPSSRYIHAFGTIGRGLGLVPFHHYWLRHRANGGTSSLWNHSATALAAAENRFGRPQETPGGLPSGVNWAFQFDAGLYAAFLRRYAEAKGVVRTEGRVIDVALDGESGRVTHVTLASGEQVAGELFIDCSGFRGLLIEGALAAGYDDWSRYLPCDRALAVPCENAHPLTPYTRATARDAGWQWRIPLQHRTGNGLVYCSSFISDDEAAATLLANLDGAALADPRPLRFVTGRRRAPWKANVVALGLAAGFMEPLESTSIHLIQAGIARLLQLWPDGGFDPMLAAEFNRQSEFEWSAIRDFIMLHYHANARDGAFWTMCRDLALPDSLAAKIELFRAGARIVREHEELFAEVAWLQVLIGQGVLPRAHHPLAEALAPEQLDEFLGLAARHAGAVAAQMPPHDDFLARHCAAPQLSKVA